MKNVSNSLTKRKFPERKGNHDHCGGKHFSNNLMNILFSCAGRRNYLINYFRKALNGFGRIVAVDANSQASAMAEADFAELVPEVYAPDYIDRLLEICDKYAVKAIIPLNDLALPILAAEKLRFFERGIMPIVSDPTVVDVCFDKWKTYKFLQTIGLQFPKTYMTLETTLDAIATGELAFPLVVKPRWGSSSLGVEFIYNQKELELVWPLTISKIKRSILNHVSETDMEHAVLAQEKLDGPEFGLDVVNDLQGSYVATIPKQKLAMRAGETDRAITVSNLELLKIGQTLGTKLKHIGNLDCDVLEGNGQYFVVDLNPRFGGGYPFSHTAGANVPAAIVHWLNLLQPEERFFSFEEGRVFSKCDILVEINQSLPAFAER